MPRTLTAALMRVHTSADARTMPIRDPPAQRPTACDVAARRGSARPGEHRGRHGSSRGPRPSSTGCTPRSTLRCRRPHGRWRWMPSGSSVACADPAPTRALGAAVVRREVELIRRHLAPVRSRRPSRRRSAARRSTSRRPRADARRLGRPGPVRLAYALRWLELARRGHRPDLVDLGLTRRPA